MPTKQKKNRSILVGMELEVNYPSRAGVPRATIAAITDNKLLLAKYAYSNNGLGSSISAAAGQRIRLAAATGQPLEARDETLLLAAYQRGSALGADHDIVGRIASGTDDVALTAINRSAPAFGLSKEWLKSADGSAGAEFKLRAPERVSLDDANIDAHIERLLSFFDKWGFKAFTNAGTHVHLGVSAWAAGKFPADANKQRAAVLLAAAFMLSYEHVIFQLMPPSRRGNQYCPRVSGSEHEVPVSATLFDSASAWSSQLSSPLHNLGLSDSDGGEFATRPREMTTGNNVADWVLHPVLGDTVRGLSPEIKNLVEEYPEYFARGHHAPFSTACQAANGALLSRRTRDPVRGSVTSSSGYAWLALSRHLPTFEFRIFPGTRNVGLLKGYSRLAIQMLNAVDTEIDRNPTVLDFSIPWAAGEHPLFRASVHTLAHLVSAVGVDTNLAEWLLTVTKNQNTEFNPFPESNATLTPTVVNAPAERSRSSARSPECVAA